MTQISKLRLIALIIYIGLDIGRHFNIYYNNTLQSTIVFGALAGGWFVCCLLSAHVYVLKLHKGHSVADSFGIASISVLSSLTLISTQNFEIEPVMIGWDIVFISLVMIVLASYFIPMFESMWHKDGLHKKYIIESLFRDYNPENITSRATRDRLIIYLGLAFFCSEISGMM